MSESEIRPYDFADGFQRKILALAVRSNLLVKAPGAFQARFFGVSRLQSPRRRLAEIIEKFAEQNRNERPGVETMDELVRRESASLKPNEKEAFETEWLAIRTAEVTDPTFVIEEVRQWAKDSALTAAVVKAADLIETSRRIGKQDKLVDIRKMIDDALATGEPESESGLTLIAGSHSALWEEDHTRRKVSTGFRRFDVSLDGGPQFGEVMYMLAPPGGGKSASLLNLALNASRSRKGVAFFSYEMSKRALVMRMDRNITSATKGMLRERPSLVDWAVEGLVAGGAKEVWIQEFSARKHGVEEAVRIVERRRGLGQEVELVVFDFLNTMSSAKGEREKRHELAAISREISAAARELDVVVWSAALVNRKAMEKEVIRKNDIAEAFEVAAVADGMVAICGSQETRAKGQRRLFLAKLREEEDEKDVGLYQLDLARMIFREIKEEVPAPDDKVYVIKQGSSVGLRVP